VKPKGNHVGAAISLLTIAILGIFLLIASFAHCTRTSHETSFGAVINDIDPNVAIVASVVSGEIHTEENGQANTNLRIHPRFMYGLFDESILFCGNEVGRVTNPDGRILQGFYAFTYRRTALRLVDGVPCFRLVSVDKLVEAK
jgi:hypothetical protein